MEKIDISFQHRGKQYIGYFSLVAGAGAGVYHLMDDKQYYLGRLRQGSQDEWVFDASNAEDKLDVLANTFGNYITGNRLI